MANQCEEYIKIWIEIFMKNKKKRWKEISIYAAFDTRRLTKKDGNLIREKKLSHTSRTNIVLRREPKRCFTSFLSRKYKATSVWTLEYEEDHLLCILFINKRKISFSFLKDFKTVFSFCFNWRLSFSVDTKKGAF